MKRFIEVTVLLHNRLHAEMGIESTDVKCLMSIDLNEVIAYRLLFEDEEIKKNQLIVYVKWGDYFIIKETYNHFKEIMGI